MNTQTTTTSKITFLSGNVECTIQPIISEVPTECAIQPIISEVPTECQNCGTWSIATKTNVYLRNPFASPCDCNAECHKCGLRWKFPFP